MGPFLKNECLVYQAIPLLDLDWLEHGFGTAHSEEWNQETDLVSLAQIHSDICVYATGGSGRMGQGDALIAEAPGIRIGVRTADCIPVLLADPIRQVIAVVHAGWRGTAQAICVKAIQTLCERAGSSPETLLAAIGPGIGPCCYEVGAEVAVQFRRWFPERDDLDGRTRIDLAEANRRQLVWAGASPTGISTLGLCTSCSGGEFHSWRRDGKRAGRMVASARIRRKEKGAGENPRPSRNTRSRD